MTAVAAPPLTTTAPPIPSRADLLRAVQHLAACRRVNRAADTRMADLLAAFQAQHLAEIDLAKLTRSATVTAEAEVRRIAELRYAEDPAKEPAPGVTMKPVKTVRYDPAEAFSWARAKELFLTTPVLDVDAFEAFAKRTLEHGPTPGILPFATLATSGKAAIANDIDTPLAAAGVA